MPQEKQRPGFMIYFTDWDMPRKILDAENFKAFFDAVFKYAQDGEIPQEFDDHAVQVFFDSFMSKLNIDNERYQDVCRKRSEAAKKSHAPANTSESQQMQQMPANAANTNTNPNSNKISNSKSKEYQPHLEYQYQSQNQPQPEYHSQIKNASQQMQQMQPPDDDPDLPF